MDIKKLVYEEFEGSPVATGKIAMKTRLSLELYEKLKNNLNEEQFSLLNKLLEIEADIHSYHQEEFFNYAWETAKKIYK